MSAREGLSPLFGWRGAIAGSNLLASRRLVALTLSLHMNERGGSCFPAVSTIAEECGLTRKTVQSSLKDLRERGWLTVEMGTGRGHTNMYTATIPDEERAKWFPVKGVTVTPEDVKESERT